MSYQAVSVGGPADIICRYGQSTLGFRGPLRSLNKDYIACFGGSETYGRFVEIPFARVLETRLARRCINFGSLSCGLDAMTQDQGLIELANRSQLCVLQLPSAIHQSNAFYRVHLRRNDRFLAPSQDLTDLYPEVDFTEFHFVRHLLGRLNSVSDLRFETVVQELRSRWARKLTRFLDQITVPVILLWLRIDHGVSLGAQPCDPVPINTDMVQALQPRCSDVVSVDVQVSGVSDEIEDMLFGTLQQPIAEHMLGPAAHRQIALALSRSISMYE